MFQSLTVDLADRSYPIRVGCGLLGDPSALEVPGLRDGNVLLISDDQVAPLYAPAVRETLIRLGCRVRLATVPAGETSKCGEWLFSLYREAAEAGLDRRSWAVALGGGVIGDLAGFFAATWLRGIRILQIPTSLLAMVDSSVGGKTAIDLPQGKNLVGAFHQPSGVVADLEALSTLPPRQIRSGLAEVIKTAAIADAEFFQTLEKEPSVFSKPWNLSGETLITRCCRIKADVVGTDEREAGRRALLNFGHTLGHAIEAGLGYGEILHGEAVSIGMVFAARLSERLLGFPPSEFKRLYHLLEAAGLPVRWPDLSWSAVRKYMALDKKNESGALRFVLLSHLGGARSGCEAPESVLEEVWHAGRQ
ncbi:MAG: 3-dehydroquinate synthase [Kiritimatiellia bacterium]|nr:3-dehydroquinate synthase [Kiritimatiellia bacterium]